MCVWLVALWLYALRLTHTPPALHFVGLTCCHTPALCTVRAPWPKTPWMEEDCFGIAQCHGMQPFQCVGGFRICSLSPTAPTYCGIPQFNVLSDSLEFCKSDIVVPLTRMQAEGKNR